MKLLFDANISRKILRLLGDLFPGSSQTVVAGLSGETPDDAIWEYAKDNAFTIVTADLDFAQLSGKLGFPPKVIRLERMDYSTEVAAEVIRRNAVIITEFYKSSRGVLILRRN